MSDPSGTLRGIDGGIPNGKTSSNNSDFILSPYDFFVIAPMHFYRGAGVNQIGNKLDCFRISIGKEEAVRPWKRSEMMGVKSAIPSVANVSRPTRGGVLSSLMLRHQPRLPITPYPRRQIVLVVGENKTWSITPTSPVNRPC